MISGLDFAARRAGALLCAALLLVFLEAAAASTVGEVQHLLVGHHAHQHMLFADVTLDFDHHDADHDNDHHDAHQPAGHHHHNGDLGSASMMLLSAGSALVRDWQMTAPPARGRATVRVRQFPLDRPPRTIPILT
jgi:hypothetical protein